jgi:very-short-patch-repair endonuclease
LEREYRRLSNDQFLSKLAEKRGEEFEPLERYVLSSQKIKVRHAICGKGVFMTPNSLLNGRGCPLCAPEKRSRSLSKGRDGLVSDIETIYPGEYEVLSDYRNYLKKVRVKHRCGNEYMIIPGNFLKGQKHCPLCYPKNRNTKKTTEEFRKEIFSLEGGDYSLIGEYSNVKTKVRLMHNSCQREYDVLPINFLKGRRCPWCSRSITEKLIEKFLKSKDIPYVKEKTFKGMKDKGNLRIDFFIEKYNLAVEYDGDYHYKDLKGREYLADQIKKDRIKDKFCKAKGIKMLRIPFWKKSSFESIINASIKIIETGASLEKFESFNKEINKKTQKF